jgi:hypothetical protein
LHIRRPAVMAGLSALQMQGFKTDSDSIPKRRSLAISAKAQALRRSQVAQSSEQALSPEAQQRAREIAEQEAERMRQWRLMQVSPFLSPSRLVLNVPQL